MDLHNGIRLMECSKSSSVTLFGLHRAANPVSKDSFPRDKSLFTVQSNTSRSSILRLFIPQKTPRLVPHVLLCLIKRIHRLLASRKEVTAALKAAALDYSRRAKMGSTGVSWPSQRRAKNNKCTI